MKKPKKDIKDIKLPSLSKLFSKFLNRYHIVTFVVLVLGGLALITFSLYSIILSSSDADTALDTGSSAFDQTTIDKVKSLNRSGSSLQPLQHPSGSRTNPFKE